MTPSFVAAFERFRRENAEAAELLFEYQIFNGAMTPPDRLLYLARFLEAYHRSAVAAKGNFVQRVIHLLEGPAAGAAGVFGGTPSDLAEAIRDTRNFYVHYNADDRARSRHGVALDNLADRVWCVVRSVLWSELGLAPEEIERILKTDWRYERASEGDL
ncbi:MAG TPA: HEPN domain-containing protein [Solirubrobacteraceae bacterium]